MPSDIRSFMMSYFGATLSNTGAHHGDFSAAGHLAVAKIDGIRGRAVTHGRNSIPSGLMPELPEVETVMRGLAGKLEGRVIRRADDPPP
jgi:hypothetical protein